MKTFRIFLESCEAINEAEFNKEWWDSKSDSFKKRYIERHPNSIYAQKAKSQPSKKDSVDKKHLSRKPSTTSDGRELSQISAPSSTGKRSSIAKVIDILKDKNSEQKVVNTYAETLLDHDSGTDVWYRAMIRAAENPKIDPKLVKRMEKEQPYIALHSPKASQEFLDAQIKKLDPFDNYTHIDVLVQNPALDTSQRETLAKKLKKALKAADTYDYNVNGDPDYFKDRFQSQLNQLLNK